MKSVVYYDFTEAPPRAALYCREHLVGVLLGLVRALTDRDN